MNAAGHGAKAEGQTGQPHPVLLEGLAGYSREWRSKQGQRLRLRAIRPDDTEKLVLFHKSLSDTTVGQRYFFPVKLSQRIEHDRLVRICSIDYDMEMVVVAEIMDGPEKGKIVGVSRLNRLGYGDTGEVAVLIVDSQQGQGLGKAMLSSILEIAREKKVSELFVDILAENRVAQNLFRQLGFQIGSQCEDGLLKARLVIEGNR